MTNIEQLGYVITSSLGTELQRLLVTSKRVVLGGYLLFRRFSINMTVTGLMIRCAYRVAAVTSQVNTRHSSMEYTSL